MTPRTRAITEQRQASDPAVSAFVAASAGSGKTKLLTDRMLRLMLGGAPPGRIQCLTFTKAAAAEMALRLQHRLGRWVTLDDPALDQELADLLVPATTDTRQKARALFSDVLDLPGGMRIGTIHAFCQSLLRRFPLEALISPQFRLVEDADAKLAMDQAREGVLAEAAPGTLDGLAGLVNAGTFGTLIAILANQRQRLTPFLALAEPRRQAAIRRALAVTAQDEHEVLDDAVGWPGEAALAETIGLMRAHGSPGVIDKAHTMLAWLGQPAYLRRAVWEDWRNCFFNKSGSATAPSKFAAERLAHKFPHIHTVIAAEQERIEGIEDQRRALLSAQANMALLTLAAPILAAYERLKSNAGQLDYTDLIGRTSGLLVDPGAAWVLYKLDGGIDHLLLDEVQDTAPQQWEIAHRLTEEFFTGLGARNEDGTVRTFFAVGDPKQSIYSFQGADPDEFSRSRARMAQRVGTSGEIWRDVTLDVSFRSTAPVLELVDATFASPTAAAGVADEQELRHYPDRTGAAGRVELWPLAPLPPKPELAPWEVPDENQGLVSAPQRLADTLAGWVAGELADGVRLPGRGRALQAGDILILVRRRDDFARGLVRALKARGVPVAGMDRMKLTDQAAVQDLLAACDAVLLPEDDLAVACVLTSPLGGLSDDSLMRLVLSGVPGARLWTTLMAHADERPGWAAALAFLTAVRARADHVTPHALLTEMLGPLGGRARLLARLGAEAAEPVDELLNAALAYAGSHPPSLQGFVQWIRASGAEVKREAGGSGGVVRIMTVHGAKGLQAPLVILPDTTALPPADEPFAWVTDAPAGVELPLWSPKKELRCAALDRAREAANVARRREYNRLLYVAMTRAEDRLLVCGWDVRGKDGPKEESWYRLVQAGMAELPFVSEPFTGPGAWEGELLVYETAQDTQVTAARPARDAAATPLPAWAGRPGAWGPAPPPPEPALPVPLAPSRPDGALYGPVPRAASPLLRTGRERPRLAGRWVHSLLQHLPDVPGDRAAAARAFLAAPGHGLEHDDIGRLLTQTLAVLDHPALAPLFAPGSRAEQPLTGLWRGTVVSGVVDRMAVTEAGVWIADFKTHRAAPAEVEDTPVRYLRQLAAYRGVLGAIYPGRPVTCTLVWTEGATVVTIPGGLLDRAGPLPHLSMSSEEIRRE